MNKKSQLLLISSTLLGLTLGGVMLASKIPVSQSLTKTNATNPERSVVSMTASSLTLDNHHDVSLTSSGLTTGDGLCKLAKDGLFYNVSNIRGIESVTVVTEGWVKIVAGEYDFEQNKPVFDGTWPDAETGTIVKNLGGVDFFQVYASAESVITSMTIQYSCLSETHDFTVSFSPDWNGKTAEAPADVYIVGTSELVSGTTEEGWTHAKMTYNAGTYSFNVNGLERGIYKYTFCAVEHDAAYAWSPCDEEQVTLDLTADHNDTTARTWSQEPGYVPATAYTLNLTVKTTGTPTSFGNMQFVYKVGSDDSEHWFSYIAEPGSSWSDTFNYALPSLDKTKTLYFFIYLWSDNTNIRVYYGGTNLFALVPSGSAAETVTITFAYSTSSPIAGVMTTGEPSTSMSFVDQTTSVYGAPITIEPTFDHGVEPFTASYSGENIRIDDNKTIVGLKAGTTTKVTLNSTVSSLSCSFNVTIPASSYAATYTRDLLYVDYGGASKEPCSVHEGWFASTSVGEISSMGADFMNGIDVSSTKALLDNGTKFYNASGVEQSLFYILKDNGVNWARLKLWVDPYTDGGVSYGGGMSDLENTLWMAKEAKSAGLKVLLDFHYSDYWTHPAQQILPKSWVSQATSVSALANVIKTYTRDTLLEFQSNGCLPDMVQLGNEISSGIFLNNPGANSETMHSESKVPGYLYNASGYKASGNYSLTANFAYKATAGSDEMNTYLTAGIQGVDLVNNTIPTVVHWARGGWNNYKVNPANTIKNFFAGITADYDYAAISFYPYYCFDDVTGSSVTSAQQILSGLTSGSNALTKPWFIAETSYPFSGKTYVWENEVDVTNHSVSDWTTPDTSIKDSYSFSPSGQANLIHDLTAATVAAGGKGIFYWEGAWVPNVDVGWAGAGSPCTWSNQGFFSYDGKALANLDLFKQMSPHV